MSLLQIQVKDNHLNIYFLSNIIEEDIVLNITLLIYNTGTQRNLDENEPIEKTILVKKIAKKIINNKEISQFTTDDEDFNSLLSKYKEGEIRIVIKKIEKPKGEEDFSEFYNFDVNLGNNTDSETNQSIDLSLIFSGDSQSDYNIRIYKVKDISPCSEEYKFNITVDRKIEGEEEKISLDFSMNNQFNIGGDNATNGNRPSGNYQNDNFQNSNYTNRTRTLKLNIECTLTGKYNNIIPCQSSMETPNFNFTMNDYLNFDEKRLISITTEEDFIFPLYCYEKPPIAAIIFITSIFFFVVIVVIVIIIFINKKGQGDKGYDPPNASNSNNILGLNSGVIPK